MPTNRETRIAEETVSAIDFFSRLVGAIESGDWRYARDKLGQLQPTLEQLGRQLSRTERAAGPPVADYVAKESQHYRIGRALYGTPKPPPQQTPSEADITPEIAAHILSHFGADGGYPASGFKVALIEAIARADAPNRALIWCAFPGYGTAQLQAIATRPDTPPTAS